MMIAGQVTQLPVDDNFVAEVKLGFIGAEI